MLGYRSLNCWVSEEMLNSEPDFCRFVTWFFSLSLSLSFSCRPMGPYREKSFQLVLNCRTEATT